MVSSRWFSVGSQVETRGIGRTRAIPSLASGPSGPLSERSAPHDLKSTQSGWEA